MKPSSLINGRPGSALDVRDRGLLYGDGLFDTEILFDQDRAVKQSSDTNADGAYDQVVEFDAAGQPQLERFDTNFDGRNEIYAANTVPFAYHHRPIRVRRGELQRVYMVNLLEFDLLNSMHLHGNFFHVYRTGTRLTSDDFTDTVMLCQGERHVLEFRFEDTGPFMFHAHQSEFTELGWMGVFDVHDELVT